MPTIYDNIETNLLDGLRQAMTNAKRGDFCVGYFNLRGWGCISAAVDQISAPEDGPACRLIVGMTRDTDRFVREYYSAATKDTTQTLVNKHKKSFARSLMQQLTYGVPTAKDEAGLSRLKKQLRAGRLQVKFFGRHPLHAKLYLVHRDDPLAPVAGYVGSSNLTLSGMAKQGELNVDVLEQDAAVKLANWFEDRWEDKWCLDITEELADIIEESWAGGPVKPYEIYIKTAYELSREAIEGSREFKVPRAFDKIMLDFQKQAVSLAAERLCHAYRGVIVGDVVGLGKTLIASAIAKTFQEDRGDNVLVICPPKLKEMWKDYMHDYKIAGKTLSLGKFNKLKKMRRFRLVIIDESHNLRNRETKRHGYVCDYIRENESRVILLTATPFNKQFTDIGNQLRLFLDPETDLGIRPDAYINSIGGTSHFGKKHPNAAFTSLAAFEHSEKADDWRELMRKFMVRRTREHIKRNYAEYDPERDQHYLRFADGDTRHYFPKRIPKCAKFAMDGKSQKDQYALLYSKPVVDRIGALQLPRYGIGGYLLQEYIDDNKHANLIDDEGKIIENLSRAGTRLIGFAKSGLFKRLESSGPAFLLSIKRHIVRNAVYLSALDAEDGKFPIGDIFASLADETLDETKENKLFDTTGSNSSEIDYFLKAGEDVYGQLISPSGSLTDKFDWIRAKLFTDSLREDLMNDCLSLLEVLKMAPEWDVDADRKLDTLTKLCKDTHPQEKILVFTQFKDTADYLFRELKKRGVGSIAEVFGSMDKITEHVKRFSPTSNNVVSAGQVDELRVLITTDTLSEGQNLQDAHIVVNFDLPWAIIRLVQRAGRVDRIGQKAKEIFCYCFLPEDGINNIIALRNRLNRLMKQNAEVIGTDEVFFEGDEVKLSRVYDESISLDEEEDETDLISRAYDIWRQATKDDEDLEKRIQTLPDVVYSSKRAEKEDRGVLAYIKTSADQHILAQLDTGGEMVTQSQSKILRLLECQPDEPTAKIAENHHKLVAKAVEHVKKQSPGLGGQLGAARSVRHRVYTRLDQYLTQQEGQVFYSPNLKYAVEQIYNFPLKEATRDRLVRQLRAGISDADLATMVLNLWESEDLAVVPKNDEPAEPNIICSMGLVE